jgi:hypothetical protein
LLLALGADRNDACGDARPADVLAGVRVRGRRLTVVKRVLLTGMSGTGKSSVIHALAGRGHKAVDTDDGWCEPLPGGRQRWREGSIDRLLATEDADVLFVAGCEENQVRFHPRCCCSVPGCGLRALVAWVSRLPIRRGVWQGLTTW